MNRMSDSIKARMDNLVSFLEHIGKPVRINELVEKAGLKRYEALGVVHFLEWLGVLKRIDRSVYMVDRCKLRLLLEVYATECLRGW